MSAGGAYRQRRTVSATAKVPKSTQKEETTAKRQIEQWTTTPSQATRVHVFFVQSPTKVSEPEGAHKANKSPAFSWEFVWCLPGTNEY